MNINAITSANSNLSSSSTSGASQTSERDLFMSLLVAQLKNQDPLQPQDGTEFVAQLAQFNSLDQLIGIRESIEKLTYQMQQLENRNTQNSESTSKN